MPSTFASCRIIAVTFVFALLLPLTTAIAAAPELFPPAGAKDICPDTVLRLTFPNPETIGKTGKIQILNAADDSVVDTIDVAAPVANQTIGTLTNFNYYPVIVTNNQADIHLHNGALAYGKTYSVKIDPGALKDFDGFTDNKSWTFTTKSAPPPAGTTKLTIAADGSGDFCSIQGAVDSLPDGNTTPTTLFIKKGTYTELVFFTNKHALTFQGEDRKETIIAYANNNRFNPATGSYRRGVFRAKSCNDLIITNLTIHNTTPQGGSQAESIILNGSQTAKAILKDVDLYSYQDTLQINGQAYITNCHIEGDVDFLWGTGPCFFENCQFKALKSKAFYTQIRNPASNHGYIFHHCLFTGSEGVKNVFLSRIAPATYPASEVVLLDCTMTDAVGDIAWRLDAAKGKPATEPVDVDTTQLHFWEFNSHTPDGKPIDTTKRLPISHQLTQSADAERIADYSNPAFVLGNDWNPQQTAPTTAPASP
jgi:pectin methylesterase-like acyl-CoA thioesterase